MKERFVEKLVENVIRTGSDESSVTRVGEISLHIKI